MSRYATPEAEERNRVASRNAKRKRTGTCVDCGATTRYNGHTAPVSRRCPPCGATYLGLQRRGTGPLVSHALEYLEQPRRFKDLRDEVCGGSAGLTSQMLYARLLKYGFVRRVSRGVYVRETT